MRIDIGDGYGAVGSLFVCLFVCVCVRTPTLEQNDL